MNEIFEMYKNNFPYSYREESIVREIINNKNNIFIKKYNHNKELIGVSIINKNTILMLCVNEKNRNKGIGTYLLNESEKIIKKNGYKEIIVGVGFNYIIPGIPTSKRFYESENENLYKNLNDNASNFFEKRGFKHYWDCNCFDMILNLNEFDKTNYNINSVIDGCLYRWADEDDIENVKKCVEDAEPSFTKYYINKKLYKKDNNQKVLIAIKNDEIVGAIIVGKEIEAKEMGSVGCTTVMKSYRGNHIGVNMTIIATKILKDIGLKCANLNYTYSGMDHLYGYSNYKISCYYMMAKKTL